MDQQAQAIGRASVSSIEGLFDTERAAHFLGMSTQFVEQDRSTRRHGIPFVKLGRAVRYRRADLEAWVQRNLVSEPEAA